MSRDTIIIVEKNSHGEENIIFDYTFWKRHKSNQDLCLQIQYLIVDFNNNNKLLPCPGCPLKNKLISKSTCQFIRTYNPIHMKAIITIKTNQIPNSFIVRHNLEALTNIYQYILSSLHPKETPQVLITTGPEDIKIETYVDSKLYMYLKK